MKTFEVRNAKALTVRVEAENELDALNAASDFLDDDDEGIIEDATDRPVGAEGVDPEEGLM